MYWSAKDRFCAKNREEILKCFCFMQKRGGSVFSLIFFSWGGEGRMLVIVMLESQGFFNILLIIMIFFLMMGKLSHHHLQTL